MDESTANAGVDPVTLSRYLATVAGENASIADLISSKPLDVMRRVTCLSCGLYAQSLCSCVRLDCHQLLKHVVVNSP